jgi:NHL repeat
MRTSRIILGGLAALGLSLAASPIAQASVTYGQIASLGAGEEVRDPLGVAVNQANGDVYVGSLLNSAKSGVRQYNRFGEYLATFGPDQPTSFTSGVAVDPVNGNVYVVNGYKDMETQVIETYGSSGGFVSEFSIAGSANLFGSFTVVQIASDSAGNVYLPNAPNNEVQEFSPSGSVLATFTGSGAEALKEPTGVAVAQTGNVYVADNGNGRVEELSPSGAFVMALGTGVNQTTGGSVCTAASGDTCGPGSDGSQTVAVDGAGDVFAGDNSGSGFHVVLYGPAGEELSDFGLGTIGTEAFGAINTIAVAPSGWVYVTDGSNEVVWIYARQSRPSLVSESSSAVRQTAATLDAKIVPGYANTTYHFEYGTSAAYGASIPVPDGAIGNGGLNDTPVSLGRELTGLQTGTTYHYRVVATNALGQTVGADQTFTTPLLQPPVVSTGQASGVAQNSATLTGTIDTQGFETVYEFDIGVDTSYGTRIFGDAGVEPGAHTFTAALQGLMPGTTYHYRILATNTFGTTYGADQTFTTASYPSATLAEPETPPLLPTPLLAPAGGIRSASSIAGEVGRSSAHSARHRRARESGHGRGRRGRRGRSGGSGHAHDANRGGGR